MITLALVASSCLLWLLSLSLGSADMRSPWLDVLHGVALIATTLTAARLTESALSRALLRNPRRRASSDLLRLMISITLYAIAVLLVLRFGFHQDPIGLLATSTVLSIIVGLALQPTLGNFFAGASIEMERPLRIGDYVRHGTVEGRIEALRWRSVYIRSSDRSLICMPNSEFTSRAVEIIPFEVPVRHTAVFTVPSEVPPGLVIHTVNQALRCETPGVCSVPEPFVVILGVDSLGNNLRYGLRFFTLAFLDRIEIASQLIERSWYALSRAGIRTYASELPRVAPGQPPDAADDLMELRQTTAPAYVPAPVDPSWLEQQLPGLGPNAAQAFIEAATRRRYACGEALATENAHTGMAIILSGQWREALHDDEIDVDAEVQRIATVSTVPGASKLSSQPALQALTAVAAEALGPFAHTLAERYASQSDDPYLICRALARSIADDSLRQHLLAAGPPQPSRSLDAGAIICGGDAPGPTASGRRCWATCESELLCLDASQTRSILAQATDPDLLCATLRVRNPGCRSFVPEKLHNSER